MEITKKEENITIIRKTYKIIKERYAIHGNSIHSVNFKNINISDDERFCIYFDDDDMFWGHTITVYGNLNGKLKDATIEG